MISLLAQTSLETKSHTSLPALDNSISMSNSNQFLQMFIVLGIVLFAIKFFLPKFILKINPGLQKKGDSSLVVEESFPFASGKLSVISIHGKRLLIASTTQNITCLADFTPNPVQKAQDDPLAFFEVLDTTNKKNNIDKAFTEVVSSKEIFSSELESFTQDINPKEIKNVLDRMSRFTGS